mmetsp:Transcript_72377/g.172882  ORF Transcript_72377/g.172882 Transcript_72377/m.172882 type:complete len:294 (+) Transcript_72377:772-1653(+)
MLAAYISRRAVFPARAHAAQDAWFPTLPVFRVVRVQPHHVNIDVIPKGKCRNVPAAQGLAHGLVATFLLKVVLVIEKLLHVLARLVCDGVWIARCLRKDRDGWACHRTAVLHVEAANFRKIARVSTIRSEELRHDGHRPARVDSPLRSRTIERSVLVPERVDVAAILVTNSVVSLTAVIVSTLSAAAHVLTRGVNVTRVWGISRCHFVRLPNVHLCTACTIVAKAHGVAEVFGMRLPILRVRLAVNELHIVRALCITVSGTILGTCGVVADVLAAIGGHLDEVHRPIHAALHF